MGICVFTVSSAFLSYFMHLQLKTDSENRNFPIYSENSYFGFSNRFLLNFKKNTKKCIVSLPNEVVAEKLIGRRKEQNFTEKQKYLILVNFKVLTSLPL